MRTLLLLRHAKSSWKQEGISDHDRPLNQRGTSDAPRMGRLLHHLGLRPELVLTSSAVRARRTAEVVVRSASLSGRLETDGRLYLADPAAVLDVVGESGDEAACVMVVGHNPGLEQLVGRASGTAEVVSLPTAALAQIEFDIETWSDLRASMSGRLVGLWRPRELDEE